MKNSSLHTLKSLKDSKFKLTWHPPEAGSIIHRCSCKIHNLEFSEYGLTREEATDKVFSRLDSMNITKISL